VLNRKLNKDLSIRCSNWEIEKLSESQIIYAADDALSALQIFSVFLDELGDEKVQNILENSRKKTFWPKSDRTASPSQKKIKEPKSQYQLARSAGKALLKMEKKLPPGNFSPLKIFVKIKKIVELEIGRTPFFGGTFALNLVH